jgi:hypothetical protein
VSELTKLRVSVARVAQTVGLDEYIPGAAGREELPYELLCDCAEQNERGWNALCARIIEEIVDLIVRQSDKEAA